MWEQALLPEKGWRNAEARTVVEKTFGDGRFILNGCVGLAIGQVGRYEEGPAQGIPGSWGPAFSLPSTPYILFSLRYLKAVAHHAECIYEVVISFPMFY